MTNDPICPVEVLVAGAQKAGTTSLKNALALHPDIEMHDQVEFPYFIAEHLRSSRPDEVMRRYFPSAGAPGALRVAKSVGVMYDDDAVDFALRHNPELRFVVVLRDPVGRAFSAFRYARRMGWEPESDFETALVAPTSRLDDDPAVWRSCAYLRYSRIREHIERLESRVGSDRLLVELYDDLRADPTASLARIVDWIGVEPYELAFPRSNEAGVARSERLARLLRPRGRRSRIARLVQRALPRRAVDLGLERMRRVNVREAPRERPSAGARRIVLDECAADVRWLEERLGRDLSSWLGEPARDAST